MAEDDEKERWQLISDLPVVILSNLIVSDDNRLTARKPGGVRIRRRTQNH